MISPEDPLARCYAALERRHLSELSFAEVRRGLEALSRLYVERRHRLASGGVLDGRGKRAAFALFYGPLHFAVTRHAVRELDAARGLDRLLDLGCGSGAAGAAWALERRRMSLAGLDLHPWAVAECNWLWRTLELDGTASRGRLEAARLGGAGTGILLAYTVNELDPAVRDAQLPRMIDAHRRGARVLVIEPVSRAVAPWFEAWAAAFEDAGGRADTWRINPEMPEGWRLLDRAARLDHREIAARTLFLR